tara:strand:+ start:19 stop:465 length:447 start_codon:yes stop_codon:yes gene_type:complete
MGHFPHQKLLLELIQHFQVLLQQEVVEVVLNQLLVDPVVQVVVGHLKVLELQVEQEMLVDLVLLKDLQVEVVEMILKVVEVVVLVKSENQTLILLVITEETVYQVVLQELQLQELVAVEVVVDPHPQILCQVLDVVELVVAVMEDSEE